MTTTVIIFQFVPGTDNGTPFTGRVPSYYDKLNSWVNLISLMVYPARRDHNLFIKKNVYLQMGQILVREVPQVNVEICELENFGLVLRLCPLEGVVTIKPEDVDLFLNSLSQQLVSKTRLMQILYITAIFLKEILMATVRLKIIFQEKVIQNPRLRLVEMPGWAGLGGVCYLPTIDQDAGEQFSPSLEDINKLNMELVNKLRNTDNAFSLGMYNSTTLFLKLFFSGEGVDGLVCVRFGMVTADTDVDELLNLVLAVGAQVEESARNLDFMVEIVKKGKQKN